MQQKAVGDVTPTYETGPRWPIRAPVGRGGIPDAEPDHFSAVFRNYAPNPKSTGDWAASHASTA